MRFKRFGLALQIIVALWGLGACNFAVQSSPPTPTPTPTPTLTLTATPEPTVTPTVTPLPTETTTPTITVPPTETSIPSDTPPPTPIPTASATPYPAVRLANDQYKSLDIPETVRSGLTMTYFAIASINERTGGTSNPETPQPDEEVSTLYLINPSSGQSIEVMDIPASADDRVFWSPDGKKLIYFVEQELAEGDTLIGGLYLANLELGISLRLYNMPSLNPRGIPEHYPVWSPDSSQFAIALPTDYDVELFVVSADGSVSRNVTQHGAFDFWPTWSPDGSRLAFVSDRNECQTWVPAEPGSCSQIEPETSEEDLDDLLGGESANTVVPTEGNVFVMDIATESVRQVSELVVDSPPIWVSNLQIGFTTGLSDPLATNTEIWLVNIQAGTARRVSGDTPALNLGAAWDSTGQFVVYQRASEPAGVVLHDFNGNEIAYLDQFLFARYGFSATWSPGGEWVAFGGRNTQCPYGLVVARNTMELFFVGTSPFACEPRFSPDGLWLGFAGIQTRTGAADGRLDLYISQSNGYGARNLTSGLKGDIRLLGWIGPS